MNSSPGHDDENVKILKEVIICPLNCIGKISLETGSFPDQCKISKIGPIFKKGETNKLGNYRRVSVLPAVSKIFERLIYNRLITFVGQLNIINSNPCGFRKNYSTSLLEFYQYFCQ